MVRATAASLTATSNPADTSPTPASRVAELGEHIDATLRIHEPAVEAEAPSLPQAELPDAERLTVPFTEETKCRAFVFVRKLTEEGADDTYEAAVALNGSIIESGAYIDSRRNTIKTILTTLYYHIARQSSANMKAAARELNKIVKDIADLPEGVDLPAGTPCEWPLKIDDEEETINEDGDVECEAVGSATELPEAAASEAADAGEACGEEEVVEPDADRAAREKLAREVAEEGYRRQYAAASDDYIQASADCAAAEIELKEAKAAKKEAWTVLEAIRNRGPRYIVPLPSTTTAPAIPSHATTLSPPDAESSHLPQAGEPQANAPAAVSPDWQSVDISALGLPPSLEEKLRENGCPTIGKLEALRGSFDGLKSIRGIGKAKIDTIEDAVLAWLSKNRDSAALTAAKESAIAGEAVGLEMAAQAQ